MKKFALLDGFLQKSAPEQVFNPLFSLLNRISEVRSFRLPEENANKEDDKEPSPLSNQKKGMANSDRKQSLLDALDAHDNGFFEVKNENHGISQNADMCDDKKSKNVKIQQFCDYAGCKISERLQNLQNPVSESTQKTENSQISDFKKNYARSQKRNAFDERFSALHAETSAPQKKERSAESCDFDYYAPPDCYSPEKFQLSRS